MDEAVRTRSAATSALADVNPPGLRSLIDSLLEDRPMTPGALALRAARAVDPTVDPESVADRAAGVQLIYEGLRLTRRLGHEEPWTGAGDRTAADVDVLAADVLVARGFYLLARTGAADRAVETVQAFGRDQTARRERPAEAAALDARLERDVLVLAVVAGTAAVGAEPSPSLLERARDLARSADAPLQPADQLLPEVGDLRPVATGRSDAAEDQVRHPATDS